jgi:hypothetical protein
MFFNVVLILHVLSFLPISFAVKSDTSKTQESIQNFKIGPWTIEEDKIVLNMYQDPEIKPTRRWVLMSNVLGRSAKHIREHYTLKLDLNLKPVAPWTRAEDDFILNQVAKAREDGKKFPAWTDLGKQLKRTRHSIRKRYTRTLYHYLPQFGNQTGSNSRYKTGQ